MLLSQYFRTLLGTEVSAYDVIPDAILMNGKGPYVDSMSTAYESFTVEKGTKRGKEKRKSGSYLQTYRKSESLKTIHVDEFDPIRPSCLYT